MGTLTCLFSQFIYLHPHLGRVVRKPFNANPRSEVNRAFHLAR